MEEIRTENDHQKPSFSGEIMSCVLIAAVLTMIPVSGVVYHINEDVRQALDKVLACFGIKNGDVDSWSHLKHSSPSSGIIDEIQLYPRELTLSQVNSLYEDAAGVAIIHSDTGK